MNILLVFIGGGIGSVLRFLLNKTILGFTGTGFPYGVLLINIIGSFVIGLVAGFIKRDIPITFTPEQIINFVMVGILGGFTTFSAFSLEVVTMINEQRYSTALIYIISSVVLGILAAFTGLILGR